MNAKFTPTKSHYHCNEHECVAVTWVIEGYCPYLEDSHFILRTDGTALTWLRQIIGGPRLMQPVHPRCSNVSAKHNNETQYLLERSNDGWNLTTNTQKKNTYKNIS